jgi:hypothetical protein
MVCPLRYVLASVSLCLLLIGLFFCDGLVDEDLKPDWLKRMVKKDRSWFRFVIALLTGEILLDAYGRSKKTLAAEIILEGEVQEKTTR